MASIADEKNGPVLLSPKPAESGIVVRPPRASTVCEFDLVRERPGQEIGLKPGHPNYLQELLDEVLI